MRTVIYNVGSWERRDPLNFESSISSGYPEANVTIFFDSDCGICTATVSWLTSKTSGGEFAFVPNRRIKDFFSDNEQAELLSEKSKSTMIAYDKLTQEFFFGYDCFPIIFNKSYRRRYRILAYLMRFFLVKLIGKKIYRMIALNRRFLGGREATCGL